MNPKPDDPCSFKKDLKRFEVSVQTRNFEIDLFWKRSLFSGVSSRRLLSDTRRFVSMTNPL